MKQSQNLTVRLEEVAQRKKEAKHKRATLARALDEACRSLPNFDIQDEEEPEQRISKLRDYTQQSRGEIEKLKTEHQNQIAELQLHIPPKTPPEVQEQCHRDIQASAAKISDIVGSAAKLLEDSIEAWVNLQDHLDIGKV